MGWSLNEIEVIVPNDYKYDDEERNDFIDAVCSRTVTDNQIDEALRKGWAERR